MVKVTEYNNILNGITVQELTPSLRERMTLAAEINGVVITGVRPDSPARGLLQAGDVIMEVNRQPIRNTKDYAAAATKVGEKETVLLLIHRNGGSSIPHDRTVNQAGRPAPPLAICGIDPIMRPSNNSMPP